jgi:hypothetical protein
MADVSLPLTGAGQATATVATKTKTSREYQRVSAEDVATPTNAGSQVSVLTTATEILAANTARAGFTIIPAADIYLSFGGIPSITTFLLPAYTPYNMLSGVVFTGALNGIAVGSPVTVHVVEF